MEIKANWSRIEIHTGKYQILGLPFYTSVYEARFESAFTKLHVLESRETEWIAEDGLE